MENWTAISIRKMIEQMNRVVVGRAAPMKSVMATSQSYLMTRTNIVRLVASQRTEYSSLSLRFLTMSMVTTKTRKDMTKAKICCRTGIAGTPLGTLCRDRKLATLSLSFQFAQRIFQVLSRFGIVGFQPQRFIIM